MFEEVFCFSFFIYLTKVNININTTLLKLDTKTNYTKCVG